MRIASKTDNNHAEIVKELKKLGFSIYDTSNVGGGFTDIVVGIFNITILVEIKDGEKNKDNLTDKQIEFHRDFRGAKVIIYKKEQCHQLFLQMRSLANKIGKVSSYFNLDGG